MTAVLADSFSVYYTPGRLGFNAGFYRSYMQKATRITAMLRDSHSLVPLAPSEASSPQVDGIVDVDQCFCKKLPVATSHNKDTWLDFERRCPETTIHVQLK